MENQNIHKCYGQAVEVLKKCETKNGFFASAGKVAYDAVWSRDSMISSLGASLIESRFKKTFKNSLITLRNNQSEKGQIPNAVDRFSKRKPHTDYKSIDSTLWFIIGHYIYKQRYKDSSLFNSHKNAIKKALIWLSYQDIGEDGMLEQLPTSDWQDAFPHKYGHTINTQALYYKVLTLIGKKTEAEKLKNKVNSNSEDGLWERDFYVPYRWKNHNQYREIGNWFDSLGNLLSIVFNLADKNKAEKILNYIEKKNINKPYPVKAISPPIKRGDKNWQDYFLDCDAKTPYHYANAGIWTFIGGFYILSLIKAGRAGEAEKQLKKLAEANLKTNFAEWIHGKTGIKGGEGEDQAWNAGMYILAYKSYKQKKVLI